MGLRELEALLFGILSKFLKIIDLKALRLRAPQQVPAHLHSPDKGTLGGA